jgi:hypothetical protein
MLAGAKCLSQMWSIRLHSLNPLKAVQATPDDSARINARDRLKARTRGGKASQRVEPGLLLVSIRIRVVMPVELGTQPESPLTAKPYYERRRIPRKGHRLWSGEVLRLVELHDETNRPHE